MPIDPVLRSRTQTFSFGERSDKPEFTGHNLPTRNSSGAGAEGPETILPDLLALNLQLLNANAPTAEQRGARVRES